VLFRRAIFYNLIISYALAFIDRNTRHPMRIVGLNRIRLNEYPVEAHLNERQKKTLAEVMSSGFVSSGWLVKHLGVTYDTANRDLKELAKLNILVRSGRGRAARYILADGGAGK
jgi:predicted HTH transcriptional regulator